MILKRNLFKIDVLLWVHLFCKLASIIYDYQCGSGKWSRWWDPAASELCKILCNTVQAKAKKKKQTNKQKEQKEKENEKNVTE